MFFCGSHQAVHHQVIASSETDYSFALADTAKWTKYLQENGYVVVQGVAGTSRFTTKLCSLPLAGFPGPCIHGLLRPTADAEQVSTAVNLFWSHLCATKGVARRDHTTWGALKKRGADVPYLPKCVSIFNNQSQFLKLALLVSLAVWNSVGWSPHSVRGRLVCTRLASGQASICSR